MGDDRRSRPGKPKTGAARCPLPCGKVRFLTRKQARDAARNFHSEPRHMRTYRRPQMPGFWHLTTGSAQRTAWFRDLRAGGAA
jgi:hypothetical protein